jgi:hypothetical protein
MNYPSIDPEVYGLMVGLVFFAFPADVVISRLTLPP